MIGSGSFGTVIKAIWVNTKPDGSKEEIEVAVKVLTRSSINTTTDEEYSEIVKRAVDEVVLLIDAEHKIGMSYTYTLTYICILFIHTNFPLILTRINLLLTPYR